MKTAIASNPEIVPSNIISFLGYLHRRTGVAGKSTSRLSPSAQKKSGGIYHRLFSQDPSQSDNNTYGLLAETREILTRHFGGGAVGASAHLNRLISTASKRTGLFALQDMSGPDDSSATDVKTPNHRSNRNSISQSQMAEMFALKRQEKPPENFFMDFIEEFHKRIEPTSSMSRPSAFPRNATQSS